MNRRSFFAPLMMLMTILAACSAANPDATPAATSSEALTKGCAAGTRLCGYAADIGSICCSGTEVCVDGACQQPTVTRSGTIYPSQLVLGLLYRAPGNQSTVTYGAGSTLGSGWTSTLSNQFDGTFSLNFGVMGSGSIGGDSGGMGGVGVSANGSGSVTDGWTNNASSSTTVQTTKTTTQSFTLASSQDALNHQNDVFILWTNPEVVMTMSGTGSNAVVRARLQTVGAQPMSWLAVTAGEIDGSVAPDSPTVAAFLATLSLADKASILALDPLRSGPPGWFPGRYVPLPSAVEVAGPELGLSDQVTLQGQTTSQFSQTITNTSYTGDSDGMSISATVFSLGFSQSGKQTMSTVVSGTTTEGSQQSASATIKSSTNGIDQAYDVYYDTLFNSFAFAPAAGSRPGSPCAKGAPGQLFGAHMAGCQGAVTYANRGTLCSGGSHVCSSAEYLAGFGAAPPTYDYWTNDALNYGGSGTNACFASTTSGVACPAGQPMRVCSGSIDPLGNKCNWVGCGGNGATSPNDYFGGCVGNATAGALCCY